MTAVIKETITIFQYKFVYILYRFYACCTGIPNVSLLQKGCCNMATINIMHFTTLQLKSHAAQYLTSYAINTIYYLSPGHTDVTQSSHGT